MSARGQWIAVGLIVAGLGAALVAGLALTPEAHDVNLGDRAPEFHAIDVATGDTVTLAHYAGKVVLLNVWATWCVPCEAEMPSLQRLHDALADSGLAIVAVSVDDGATPGVRRWVADRRLTFDVLHSRGGPIEILYQTIAVPETFVIDRDGIIVKKQIGALDWDAPEQLVFFRTLLGAGDAVAHNAP